MKPNKDDYKHIKFEPFKYPIAVGTALVIIIGSLINLCVG
jgi:hypothetical protein